MRSPCWAWVRALNALQNSMMLTPRCPSAGPTGGLGVACPAGICSFTSPTTFFAIFLSRLFHLHKVKFDRRRSPEDADQDPEFPLLRLHFLHHAGKVLKRSVNYFNTFPYLKQHFRLGP